MDTLLLSLGSNEGDRLGALSKALAFFEKEGIKVIIKSSVYETEPKGVKNQPWFLNMCLEIQTKMPPEEFLEFSQKIEEKFGRTKKGNLEPRTLDIDILWVKSAPIFQSKNLILPHPRLHERRFVLIPLVEIAPNWIHPVLQKTALELLNTCVDTSIVNPYDRP